LIIRCIEKREIPEIVFSEELITLTGSYVLPEGVDYI